MQHVRVVKHRTQDKRTEPVVPLRGGVQQFHSPSSKGSAGTILLQCVESKGLRVGEVLVENLYRVWSVRVSVKVPGSKQAGAREFNSGPEAQQRFLRILIKK